MYKRNSAHVKRYESEQNVSLPREDDIETSDDNQEFSSNEPEQLVERPRRGRRVPKHFDEYLLYKS